MKLKYTIPAIALAAIALGLMLTSKQAQAREELVTLPNRDRISITIYNEVDLTFVQEERALSFNKGENRLQFSWANTLIDPTSVMINFLDSSAGLEISDTSYPAGESTALIWSVQAEEAVATSVAISYFTSGISWQSSYEMRLNAAGSEALLTPYVSVTNNSGEEYEDAEINLIIGNVNLVESIRQLAQGGRWEEARAQFGAPKREAEKLEGRRGGLGAGGGGSDRDAATIKRVAKESVGEYAIFKIEGTETVSNGWTKRMRMAPPSTVKTIDLYASKPKEFGTSALVRVIEFKNDKESGLGEYPIPAGSVQVMQEDAGRLSLVGSTQAKYLPIKDKARWNLGADPLVQLEVKMMNEERERLAFTNAGRFQRLSGWDYEWEYMLEVRNNKRTPIALEIHQTLGSTSDEFISADNSEVEDAFTRKWRSTLNAGETFEQRYEVLRRMGTNVK